MHFQAAQLSGHNSVKFFEILLIVMYFKNKLLTTKLLTQNFPTLI